MTRLDEQAPSLFRYWDKRHGCMLTKIKPGEYCLSPPGEGIVTILGSCISACIRDPFMSVGGMNHFMLPSGSGAGGWDDAASAAARYGDVAMERLINEIMKRGGRKERFEVKLFGGASMGTTAGNRVGESNIRFAVEFLRNERLPVTGHSLGGNQGRKVIYFPDTGQAWMLLLPAIEIQNIEVEEREYARQLEQTPVAGSIELF